MAIEEAMEEKIQGAALQIIEGGARLTVRVAKSLALALLNSGWQLAKGGAGKAIEAIEKQRGTGNVGEKRLQQMGEDVHEIRLDDQETLKEVTRSLRQAGLTYGVEKTTDGGYYLHFQGKDADHLMHAVDRAFKQLGLEFNPSDVLKVPAETAQERTGTETPEERTGATRSTEAGDPEGTPEPETTGRIEWEDVRPDILDYAATEFAATHEQLAGLTPQETRDAIDKDPELRQEFDKSLHDDYGQTYASESVRRRDEPPAPAEGRATSTDAGKPEPAAAPTPGPGDDAGNVGVKAPWPKTRKEFFERFRTRYKAKLDDAKTRKAPAKKLDRTRNR